jgi:ATP-dependent DNA helicase RecG
LIETWGYGTLKIFALCKEANLLPPLFKEEFGGISLTFFRPVYPGAIHTGERTNAYPGNDVLKGGESGGKPDLGTAVLTLLEDGALSKSEIAIGLNRKKVTRYLDDLIKKLLHKGLIEYTIPGKPSSRMQKYRLAGRSDQ